MPKGLYIFEQITNKAFATIRLRACGLLRLRRVDWLCKAQPPVLVE